MKKLLLSLLFVASLSSLSAQGYQPSEEVRRSQQEFSEDRFGIFIHWGIYSMYAQGEWYLQNAGLNRDEYAKAADAFYPHRFDAKEWVSAIKASGAQLGFVDRFSGTVIVTGTYSEVEASLAAITEYAQNKLGFSVCDLTKT